MDGSLKELGSIDVAGGAATFFPEIRLGIEVKVMGLLSLTMAELQAVALTLECVPSSYSVERHIANLVSQKNISVVWLKVKGHSSMVSNNCVDVLAGISAHSSLLLPTNDCGHLASGSGHAIWIDK
ncbi:hypothetical protein G9A89_017203 [Geosiphon pyriformis]|nr:hypothetical protein G9A89_017203 [Geosiphon pyriformis]